jgi:hypothetical protein
LTFELGVKYPSGKDWEMMIHDYNMIVERRIPHYAQELRRITTDSNHYFGKLNKLKGELDHTRKFKTVALLQMEKIETLARRLPSSIIGPISSIEETKTPPPNTVETSKSTSSLNKITLPSDQISSTSTEAADKSGSNTSIAIIAVENSNNNAALKSDVEVAIANPKRTEEKEPQVSQPKDKKRTKKN